MPRKTTYGSLDPETPDGRIAILLRDVWGGNQRRMAEDVGVTQPAISQVVRGDKPPGRRLLELVAADPKVNADWVLRGVGEPTPAPAPEVAGGDWMAPVAGCILPGHPRRHAALLTGARLPVATFYRSESRYLLAAQPGDPVVRAEGERVAPGDHLLMETDRGIWLDNRPVLLGKLVALRLDGGRGVDYVLARADLEPATRELSFNCFGVRAYSAPDAGLSGETAQGAGNREAGADVEAVCMPASPKRRSIMLNKERQSSGIPVESADVQPPPPSEPVPVARQESRPALPSIDDVVAVCILLIRM